MAEGFYGADNGDVNHVKKKMIESREHYGRISVDMDVLIEENDTTIEFVKHCMASVHAGGAYRPSSS